MRFGETPIDEATGAILAHSWRANGINFAKGRRLSAEDVGKLKAAGASSVIAARLDAGDMHEDEAAEKLARAASTRSCHRVAGLLCDSAAARCRNDEPVLAPVAPGHAHACLRAHAGEI